MSEEEQATSDAPKAAGERPRIGIRHLHRRTEDAMSIAAGGVGLVMMVLMSVDTFGRYLLGSPITGTYEMVERVLMVLIVWLAVPRTLRIGGHVSVQLFVQRMTKPMAAWLRLVPQLVAAGIWFYVAYRGWTRGLDRLDSLVRTTAVPFPQGLPWLIMAVGAAALGLRALIDTFDEIRGRVTDRDRFKELQVLDD